MLRSPAAASELAINWIEAEWPTKVDDKYGEIAMPLSALSELSKDKHKPSLVVVFRDDEQDQLMELEQKMFGSEDVVLASRFFRFYRIADSDITDEKIRKKYLKKKGPTLIFLDAKGNEVKKVSKAVKTTWLFSQLKSQFSSDFDDKLAPHVKKLSAWLKELEKAEDKKVDAEKALESVKELADNRETDGKKKRIAKLKASLEKLEAAFDKVKAKGKELSNPKPKEKATAKK